MQRLKTHLDHLRRLDDLAQADTFLHRLHPAVKILVTAAFLITLASYGKYDLASMLPLALYPAAMIGIGRLPWGYFAERLLFLAPFVLMLALANPLLDPAPAIWLGPWTVSGGWLSCLSILLRFVLAVTAVLILVASTGMNDIGAALRRAGVPSVLVLQLLLLYRYLSLLLEEAYRLEQSYVLRAGGSSGIAPRAWGSLAGLLLLRTYSRAQRIYEAMLCRGFDGRLHFGRDRNLSGSSLGYLGFWLAYFVLARGDNLPARLGTLIKGVWG